MAAKKETISIIDGVEVRFPYKPYGCQNAYMEAVIKAVKNCENAILESPTGTGKTLSLICSTLACLWHERNNAGDAFKPKKEGSLDEESLLNTISTLRNTFHMGNKPTKEVRTQRLRIIYSSRTHSQLKQVIKEAKKTSYTNEFASKGLTAVVLGSRDQLCIHHGRGNLTGEALNAFCKQQVQTQGCMYYNGMKRNKGGSKIQFYEFMDIEELVSAGKAHSCCPFYASRSAHEDADVTLLPYNYLFSPMSRDSMEIKFKNSILIIDEAHNVESVAEAAAGFKISQEDIRRYLGAVKRLGAMYRHASDPAIHGGHQNTDITTLDISTVTKSAKRLRNLNYFLEQFVLNTEKINKPLLMQDINLWNVKNIKRANVVSNGPDMLRFLMRTMELAELRTAKIDEALRGCIGMLSTNADQVALAYHSIYDNSRRVQEDIQALTSSLSFFQHIFSRELQAYPEYFHVMITESKSNTRKKDEHTGSKTSGFGTGSITSKDNVIASLGTTGQGNNETVQPSSNKVVSFECLQATPSFLRLKNEEVRSILLTSGTLSPLNTLERSIGGNKIKFAYKLSNDHVIPPSNICAFSVGGTDDSSIMLSSDYNTRYTEDYVKALGETLLTFVQNVPAGVLVFFGSYETMEGIVNKWKRMGIYGRLEKAKKIFLETRGDSKAPATYHRAPSASSTDTTQAQLKEYKELTSEGKGCAFIGICRGKIAEGIDFSDNACRGVFMCGIPYPSIYEDSIALKMDYLRLMKESASVMNERSWYTAQAIRAVNQAIGRTIRHISDYGVILLADRRFSRPQIKKGISEWVSRALKDRNSIRECLPDIREFLSRFGFKTDNTPPEPVLFKPKKLPYNFFKSIIDSVSQIPQNTTDTDLHFKRRRFEANEDKKQATRVKPCFQIAAVSHGFRSKSNSTASTTPDSSQQTESTQSGWDVVDSWSNQEDAVQLSNTKTSGK